MTGASPATCGDSKLMHSPYTKNRLPGNLRAYRWNEAVISQVTGRRGEREERAFGRERAAVPSSLLRQRSRDSELNGGDARGGEATAHRLPNPRPAKAMRTITLVLI